MNPRLLVLEEPHPHQVAEARRSGELRLHGEMILEISQILAVTPNEILGAGERKEQSTAAASRRLLRRLQALEKLPKRDQEAVLRTIDAFLVKAS